MIKIDNLNIIRGLNRKVEINIVYKTKGLKEVVKEEKEYHFLNGKLKVGDKITLDNILFKTGYSYIEKESIPVLEMMADALRERNASARDRAERHGQPPPIWAGRIFGVDGPRNDQIHR